MLLVQLGGLAVHHYVIQVDNHTHVQDVGKDVIHHVLERGRGIGQSKWKDSKLKMPIPGVECRLVDVSRVHANLVIARTQVQLSEALRPVHAIQ